MVAGNMFTLIAIFIISSVLPSSLTYECIYDDRGLCMSQCPPETVSYTSGCGEPAVSQRTCRRPVVRSLGIICDLSRCDCVEPKVWDPVAKKCVRLEDCSEQKKTKGKNRIV